MPNAYERHQVRLDADDAYRAGFEHGLAGHEADQYPDDPTDANAWGEGWRVGIGSHRFLNLTEDLSKAVTEALQAIADENQP